MHPFSYPVQPIVRRHGPRGYRDLESFRPWLRDDFCFRCVFCLRREVWDRPTSMHIDHFRPTRDAQSERSEYDNLLYACSRCNLVKSSQTTPDPGQEFLSDRVQVTEQGEIATFDVNALRLIAQLRLNSPEMVHFRRLWIEIVAMAQSVDEKLTKYLLGFPDDLPNLRLLSPPQGNDRPEGVEQSYWAQRERHELPETY